MTNPITKSNNKSALHEYYNMQQQIVRDANENEGKVNQAVKTPLKFKKVAEGAAKVVLVPKLSFQDLKQNQINLEIESKAYYVPQNSFFDQKRKELEEEVETCNKIENDTKHDGKKYLAIDLKPLEKEYRIKNLYSVETSKAKGDLEKNIQTPIGLSTRIKYGFQYLMGLAALHDSNHSYGDTKPENCLTYDSEDIKISDFGKAKEAKEDKPQKYTGNMRFAPPEGQQSKAGDVYSGGLLLIRILEEEYLQGTSDPLITVNKDDLDVHGSDKVRGVEKYMVEHKAFTACESRGWAGVVRSCFRRVFKLGKLTEGEKAQQKTALDLYIAQLTTKLKGNDISEKKCEDLKNLLMQMTDPNPNKRPTADEASKRFSEFMK
jgi:serine/threonine protein kinase